MPERTTPVSLVRGRMSEAEKCLAAAIGACVLLDGVGLGVEGEEGIQALLAGRWDWPEGERNGDYLLAVAERWVRLLEARERRGGGA